MRASESVWMAPDTLWALPPERVVFHVRAGTGPLAVCGLRIWSGDLRERLMDPLRRDNAERVGRQCKRCSEVER